MHIFKNTNFDFLRWRWHAIALSWVIIIAGIVDDRRPRASRRASSSPAARSSSSSSISRSPSQQVRTALDRNYPGGGQNTVVQAYGDPPQHQVMIRVPQVGAEPGASLQHDGSAGRGRARRRPDLGNVHTASAAEIVGADGRAGADEQGLLGDGAVARSASCCISRSASSSASASAPSSRRFTTC